MSVGSLPSWTTLTSSPSWKASRVTMPPFRTVALKFGTAGLRGVIGAGTNRMNIYVVRQATQGLANWVKTQGGSQTVAISYDSRIKSNLFARTAAEDEDEPTPPEKSTTKKALKKTKKSKE